MKSRPGTSILVASLFLGMASGALPHEPAAEGCSVLSRNLAHELTIMRGAAVSASAVSRNGGRTPQLQLDTYYAVSLAPQDTLHFAAKPGRASKASSLRGGVFRFVVPAPGRYRISISSRHWIDVVDAANAIDSVDHFGPGCELVHKVVEFDLPSGRPLTLQLSGHDDAMVGLAITASPKESQ